MVEFVLIGLLGLDQDHSFYLVLIELSLGDWKGWLVEICEGSLYLGGWYFHIGREVLMLSNKIITNLSNLINEEVIESVDKVFVGDTGGHGWVFGSAKKVITYFIYLFVVQGVLSHRCAEEIPFSFI